MVHTVSFHSLKGGTGKTTLASNFAVLSAMAGEKACLLDFDFRAPSLHALFRSHPNFWLNDFLNGQCGINETLQKIDVGTEGGTLAIGFANPSIEAMRDMMTKDREWEAEAFRSMLSAKTALTKGGYDMVVFDTSPGIQYSSVNALAASNLIVLVMNKEELHREDIVDLVNKIYKPLNRKIGIVLNKVLLCLPETKVKNKLDKEEASLRKDVGRKFECPVYGLIPCFCEVMVGGYEVHALNQPNHPFVSAIATVAKSMREALA